MAGGDGRKRAAAEVRRRLIDPATPVTSRRPDQPQRHCILTHPTHGRVQAYLIQWASEPTGWIGQVVYGLGETVIIEWHPAARLAPAPS